MSQSAPIVAYPVTRSRWLASLLLLISAAGLGVVVAWLWLGAPQGITVPAVAVGLWLLCSALAARFWWQSPQGMLAWDGYHWNWTPHSGAAPTTPTLGNAQLQLDWQHSLWVRWQRQAEKETGNKTAAGPAGWLWLEQRHAPAQWADVCAAHSMRPRCLPRLPWPLTPAHHHHPNHPTRPLFHDRLFFCR